MQTQYTPKYTEILRKLTDPFSIYSMTLITKYPARLLPGIEMRHFEVNVINWFPYWIEEPHVVFSSLGWGKLSLTVPLHDIESISVRAQEDSFALSTEELVVELLQIARERALEDDTFSNHVQQLESDLKSTLFHKRLISENKLPVHYLDIDRHRRSSKKKKR